MPGAIPHSNNPDASVLLQAYQSAINAAAIVSITDTRGRIIYVNDKFVEISQYSAHELIGKTHRIINSGYHTADFFTVMWQQITTGMVWRGEIKNKAKDGSHYWVDTVITPMKDEQGNVFRYLSIRNLITLQKEHEEQLLLYQEDLLKSKQELMEAQKVAKTGSWFVDIPEQAIRWSDETCRIFEIPAGIPVDYPFFIQHVHPADREMVDASWQQAKVLGAYDIEHRIRTASGEKWVREQARFEYDTAGKMTKAYGTVQDITEKKKNEEILRQSEQKYRDLFNNSPFAIGIVDKETLRFLEVNDTACKWYGYSREEFLQLSNYDIRLPESHNDIKMQLRKETYAADNSVRAHRKKNGTVIYIEPTIIAIQYKDKPAFLISVKDVTETMRIQEELKKLKDESEKEIIRSTIESEERTREAIGRELHDNINQLLVASNIFLKQALRRSGNDHQLLNKSLEINTTAIEEIRKLSSSFVAPSLQEETLEEAIKQLSQNFVHTSTKIQFNISADESWMKDDFKLNLFRIIQEQCNNIIKHAAAKNAVVKLYDEGNQVRLEITDDGKGFDTAVKYRGIGIKNIIHRTEAYYGSVNITSKPGKGCFISISFTVSDE
ncbi:MAG: PAS domain S-box protein [Bacteroidetes bacterium]|nr:PAS domain S-box protein [Bacteroidota bacterium]